MNLIGKIKGSDNQGKSRRKNLRRQGITQAVAGIFIIVLLNVISGFVFTRFDLTAEKRYSLNPATKKMLRGLEDVVFFRVYLEGDFPAGFKRLRNETKEMLDEFRAYSDHIQYEFINPSALKDKTDRNNLFRQLVEKGLEPTNLQVKSQESSKQQIIFPGALASFNARELPVQLLVNQINESPEQVLNASVQNLEFQLANTIRKLVAEEKSKIAFIEGHGELSPIETADITNALSESYTVERVRIASRLNSLAERDARDSNNVKISNKYRAIIIARPDSAFDEKDKFLIDQYIMRGGRVLWLIDPVFASMDSLQIHSGTMGVARPVNLEDQLFRYGARLNADLVMDLQACPIPVKTGQVGNQPQFEYYPWYYFPLVMSAPVHPVVHNLNAVKFEFVSSLDTVESGEVKKTVLLKSSPYSRVVRTPALISLDILREKPDERLYRGPGFPVAVLLEGRFRSLYDHRMPPEIAENKEIGFRTLSDTTRMIVISDGDVIRNYVDFRRGIPYPLGYDYYTRETYGNKDLVLNAMDYLCDDSGLITVRSREVKLRLLDGNRIERDKLAIQLANTAGPVLLLILAGWLLGRSRRMKYTRL